MKIKHVIEGGISGATTLSMLQEALHKADHGRPKTSLHKSAVIKKIKQGKKKGSHADEHFIKLAGEVMAGAGAFGLVGLGKKKHAVVRGGLLGAAAGLCVAFLNDDDAEQDRSDYIGQLDAPNTDAELKQKAVTVGLYTLGGLLAGLAVKELNKKGKKKGKLAKAIKWMQAEKSK